MQHHMNFVTLPSLSLMISCVCAASKETLPVEKQVIAPLQRVLATHSDSGVRYDGVRALARREVFQEKGISAATTTRNLEDRSALFHVKKHEVMEIAAIGQTLLMRKSSPRNNEAGVSPTSAPTSPVVAHFIMDSLGKLRRESVQGVDARLLTRYDEGHASDEGGAVLQEDRVYSRRPEANFTNSQANLAGTGQGSVRATETAGSSIWWCLVIVPILLISIGGAYWKVKLSRKLHTLDQKLDDGAKRAVSKILQNGDSIGLLDAYQEEAGVPVDGHYSELLEREFQKEDAKMQVKQLFEALSDRNDRKRILLRPGWEVLCVSLRGKVETRAGEIHHLRCASMADHQWLLSEIDAEIVNQDTFSAIFKVLVMWHIVRTIGSLKATNELWKLMPRWLSCCMSRRALDERIAISVFDVWVDVEGAGIAFHLLWFDQSLALTSSRNSSAALNVGRRQLDCSRSTAIAASLPAATRVGEYEGMENTISPGLESAARTGSNSDKLTQESEADSIEREFTSPRRLQKTRKKLVRKKGTKASMTAVPTPP